MSASAAWRGGEHVRRPDTGADGAPKHQGPSARTSRPTAAHRHAVRRDRPEPPRPVRPERAPGDGEGYHGQPPAPERRRTEEPPSELQSLKRISYPVLCLQI